jgi:hypothetical protein
LTKLLPFNFNLPLARNSVVGAFFQTNNFRKTTFTLSQQARDLCMSLSGDRIRNCGRTAIGERATQAYSAVTRYVLAKAAETDTDPGNGAMMLARSMVHSSRRYLLKEDMSLIKRDMLLRSYLPGACGAWHPVTSPSFRAQGTCINEPSKHSPLLSARTAVLGFHVRNSAGRRRGHRRQQLQLHRVPGHLAGNLRQWRLEDGVWHTSQLYAPTGLDRSHLGTHWLQ